ncbi:DUF86 domain-containing protein [Methanoplanus sp. FWC-SCC4]|uniref:DUF86 domain-containing protein n=1 Tax=Methanochimaera problematica TaxID=2609417 RepID=A0AA97I3N9_9EURY|nr:DUF86 domain-containing protein [Methanoplanus sp. FWC-SCC4]WOF15436.1 DUF86 domain-containing protein [Methanoplanus sp. FWC-SCC4]
MSKRDITLFLEDITEAAGRISDYIDNYSKKEFENDQKTIDAVVRNIEIIGEAVSNIPEDFRDKYPHIPWKRIVGVRNIVIHKYFGVDTNTLWVIINEQLPGFKSEISEIINNIKND